MQSRPQLAPPTTPVERTPEEWSELLTGWGEPGYRALQVFRWIHQRGVLQPEHMSDLPKLLRSRLAEAGVRPPLTVAQRLASQDGTHKLLLELADQRRIESVLIPRGSIAATDIYEPHDEDDQSAREPQARAAVPVTQCVSSQVGCAMGCAFCASGIAGLKRNLSASEIIAQVLVGREQLAGHGRIAGVVLMGMGEPLHNYDAVARALVLLAHPEGIGMSLRRVTLSTSGLVDGIDRLGRDFGGQVGLAISLHAVDDATRSRIMPVNRRHPLAELMGALRRYPLPPRRQLTVEYTLIAGVNDDVREARELVRLLRGLRAKVNLIPMNPVAGSELRAPERRAVDAFQHELQAQGVEVFVRKRKGDDIAAACGQLALHGELRKVRSFGAVAAADPAAASQPPETKP
jgi:23S rRNA (adenine2503-C2)-methyltransferase